ncbi:hypothetical protein V5799_002227 [Amblyomma americanum]|uniref:Serpin domain-containing protein n=1 Tax=Amblyomma americanum TaxID=6943 RepID=A0AAQ4CXY1_AMBAM
MKSVDFKNNHEAARGEANSSVLQHTSSKIKDLLPSASVSSETSLIVLNAVYIKGYWQHPFQWRYTRAQEFHLDSEHSVLVDMLFQDRGYRVGRSQLLRARALEIPYRGHGASVVILLPNDIDGLPYLQNALTTTSLCAILSSLQMVMNVELSLPKFKLDEGLLLKDTLKVLGVKDLFTPGDADLSGIFEAGRPAVSDVVHKTFLKIDEGGTDASSATAMTSLACSATMPLHVTRFVVDHPFMFIIKSNEPDTVLFMGSVRNP